LTPLSRAGGEADLDAKRDPFRGTGYRGVRQIGAGGMGEVFLVLHRELGSEFVAKVLRPELRGDARTVDRVRVEAESLGRLQHPHVVSVTDFGYSAEGSPFIVMELLNGVTLAQRLKQGPVALRDALVFTRATLSALAAAHALGIVHRDIKPHNLFLHQCEDGRTLLKVLDFGVARVLPDAPSAAPIPLSLPTQTGMVLGTPRFVSPEAAAGRPVDVRGDLYAVGLVLYQLVAGRGPFDHVRGISDVLHAHTSEVPEPPSWYAARELPVELDRVVLKALSKRPRHRYQSALEFDAALVGVQRAIVSRARSYPRVRVTKFGGPARARDLAEGAETSPAARALPCAPTPCAPAAFCERVASSARPSLVSEAASRAVLSGASASVSADGNAARPAHLPWRPMRTLLVFVGTLLLTSWMGASGATLLGRMVGGLP
jgi:serine/threonine-protein kinase